MEEQEDKEITPEIRAQVEELRKRAREEDLLTDFYDTDFNLYRWLLGWQFDINKVHSPFKCTFFLISALCLHASRIHK